MRRESGLLLVILTLVALLITGCATMATKDVTAVQEQIKQADRDFAAAVAAAEPEQRAAVWATWFADDGRQIIAGGIIQGQAAITELMQPAFTTPGFSLHWEPDFAEAGTAGDMGWTTGRYESRQTGPDGTEAVSYGRYVSIWKRQADGSWKVTADLGSPDSG